MSIGFIAAISVSIMFSIDVALYYRAKQQEKNTRKQEKRPPTFWQKYILILVVNILITISLSITIVIKSYDGPNSQPSPLPTPEVNKGDDSSKLRENLKKPYEGDGFSIEPRLDPEVVRGQCGNYYDVYLKGPSLFPIGEYIIRDAERDYRLPLQGYITEIDEILNASHVDHHLYVKGSADLTGQGTFKKSFEIDRWTFRSISYLKYDRPQEQFTTDVGTRTITGQYTNQDLPDLRARFTQEILKEYDLNASILEGIVTTNLDKPKDRNIIFLLYVKWTSCSAHSRK